MRVVSVPHDHPYVVRVTAAPEVEVAGDPSGRGDGRHVLDPDWFAANAHRFDVAHVHFGFERLRPGQLRAWLDSVAWSGVPLVLTVHDLRNPHLVDNRRQEQLLDVIVPAADVVVTLTHAAAAAIGRRWDRRAEVLPHPHVASSQWLRIAAAGRSGTRGTARPPASGRPARPRRRVGLHLKSLRTNFAPAEALLALRDVLRLEPDVEVDVRLHNDVDTAPLRTLAGQVEAAARDRTRVLVSDYLSDDDLCRWIAGLDVLLLPYRFGTHSGWIELGKDLGTAVVAPALPTYREQGAAATFPAADEHPTAAGMRDAVLRALEVEPTAPGPDARLEEAAHVVATHADIYRRLARQRSVPSMVTDRRTA